MLSLKLIRINSDKNMNAYSDHQLKNGVMNAVNESPCASVKMKEKTKLTTAQAQKLHLKLSWELLEHKWRYYVGKGTGKVEPIPDEEYDKKERVYEKLCTLLKLPATATQVGFSFERGSCRIVHEKMCMEYGLDPKETVWVG